MEEAYEVGIAPESHNPDPAAVPEAGLGVL